VSPLAVLATPVLYLDNALALKVLLPRALAAAAPQRAPLDDFRRLMGTLYGFAGLAHAFDLAVGGSQLLQAAGCPPFLELPVAGQMLAVVWCLAGPAAAAASWVGASVADAGLVAYGVVEVSCAVLATAIYADSADSPVLLNAALVQAAVAASWLYSSQKAGN